MASRPIYLPLRCWNCAAEHTNTQESCFICHGWVLPTRTKLPREPIDWKILVIISTDTDEFKKEQFKEAEIAIQGGRYMAILGAETPDSPYSVYRPEKTAVFLHRPGSDTRLSFNRPNQDKILASSREGAKIHSGEWKIFENMVGVPTPKNLLPESFPKPEHLL
ncbi:hypothetical protein EAF04_006288 [Stromatinia cepivora]|nr:hypothetical protein EAF04_006288 [Stromatinia cepivora]